MAWTYFICETITGRKLSPVQASSASFSRKLNGIGQGTHELVTSTLGTGASAAARRTSRLDLTRTWDRTIVQCWNGRPLYAGLITGKTPAANGTVSISSVDLRELFKYRTTFGINGYNGAADEQLRIDNQSLASIAGYLIWDVMQGPTGNWQLPLILPPRNIPGNQSRIYHEFSLPVIEDELTAIQDTDGGPDIDLDPSWSASDTLQWTARVGALTGPLLEWNLSVVSPAITGFGFTEDGNAQGNRLYAVGNGADLDLLVATSAGVYQPDEVALERIVNYSQEENRSVLQGRADGDRRTFQYATRQYQYSMQADGKPGALDLALGQLSRVYTQSHDWLPDGWVTSRVIGYSGDATNTIKLQLQTQ